MPCSSNSRSTVTVRPCYGEPAGTAQTTACGTANGMPPSGFSPLSLEEFLGTRRVCRAVRALDRFSPLSLEEFLGTNRNARRTAKRWWFQSSIARGISWNFVSGRVALPVHRRFSPLSLEEFLGTRERRSGHQVIASFSPLSLEEFLGTACRAVPPLHRVQFQSSIARGISWNFSIRV